MRSIHAKPRERLSSARRAGSPWPHRDSARPRRRGTILRRDVARTVRGLGLVQIDSVNVLVRSHYLPLYSRLGPYDPQLLDAAAYGGRRRQLFEYWGHEASLVPGRAPAPAALAHAASAQEWRRRLGWRGPVRQGARRVLSRSARGDCRARPRSASRISRPAASGRAAGGAGARARSRSSGCSGRARSPRTRGGASSASTTCPSGCCRRTSWPHRRPPPTTRSASCCASRCARWVWRPSATCATTSACRRSMPGRASPNWSRHASCCRSRSRAGARRAYVDARPGRAPPHRGTDAALALRFARLVSRPPAAPVRFPLPDRDLHAGPQAPARLLRAAVPARRSTGGTCRSQGGSRQRPAARAEHSLRTVDRARAVAEELRIELKRLAGWLGLEWGGQLGLRKRQDSQ